jgi:5-deoxy-glucuronate isomerase
VIRHLPGRPYDVPEFTEEHRWLLQAGAQHWWPSDG